MAGAKRALCVGINTFKNYPGAQLNGCLNDVASMQDMLIKQFGFAAEDIQTLTEAQATKAKVFSTLSKLVDAAVAGKVSHLVFSLSTHGTQVPDLDDDEADNADEAFCMHDLAEKNGEWDRDRLIIDDELRKLFQKVPKTVLIECFFDTCHSGTGLKAIDMLLTRKPRWLPPPTPIAIDNMTGRSAPGLQKRLDDAGVEHAILWAGCKANQTSADAKIGKAWAGAFTYYLTARVKAAKGQIKRSELLKLVRDDLKANRYTQIPQLNAERGQKAKAIGG
ncbi:caspase family protein [Niveibacterium sp. 24ML]|uniref:caspase family protein n=1 Tax=Niveibacterium sp. 24ML TaxID=2985512 RepID=UPI00226F9277|nr:caspase family protein [Niveibacterium sp. 24ML]MCX9158189.1 caspase family protein [Niveibacterium sp. 24ML]